LLITFFGDTSDHKRWPLQPA